MMTPFSGLSLILHLTVIGLGKIFDLFPHKKSRGVRKETALYIGVSQVFSIMIVIGLSILMLIFFGIAIHTSLREGSDEWPRRYVEGIWTSVVENYSVDHYDLHVSEAEAATQRLFIQD